MRVAGFLRFQTVSFCNSAAIKAQQNTHAAISGEQTALFPEMQFETQ